MTKTTTTTTTREQKMAALLLAADRYAAEMKPSELRERIIELTGQLLTLTSDDDVNQQYEDLTAELQQAFQRWSGGDLPSDATEVEDYVTTSLVVDIDEDSARTFLLSLIK